MKILYVILLASIIGVWGYYFLNKTKTNAIKSDALTEVFVSKRVINLGKSPLNKPVKHTFSIKNLGSEPFIIYDVKADCSCTVPKWEKEPVKSNNSTDIKVVYDGHTLGFFQKKLIVKCNNKEGDLILVIQGQII